MKLETWLRIAGVPYELAAMSPVEAPKGKVPFIEENGRKIGDSTLILEHLRQTTGKDPDEGLTNFERAASLAFRRMLKENFYWVIIQARWIDDANWRIYKNVLGSMIMPGASPEAQEPILSGIREQTKAQMHGHGMGRHTADEVYRLGTQDITAVSDFLGEKPFFMGDRPTTADAAVYAYLANLIEIPLENPVKAHGLELKNLVAYCRRMRERFYPELAAAS
jgi:glutathione S-transferase